MHQETTMPIFTGTPPRSSTQPRWIRIARRTLTVALAALLILSAAAATQPAVAGKKKPKILTETFSSDDPIAVPGNGTGGPADPYPSIINVDGFAKLKKAKIIDVNLTLRGLSHTDPDDVDVMLTRGDRQAVVMADAGNNDDANNLTITLDDEAVQDLPLGETLQSGTFRPGNLIGPDPFPAPAPAPNGDVALSTFNGINPDGEWRLFVNDDLILDKGSIDNGWELEITAKAKKEKKNKNGKGKGKK